MCIPQKSILTGTQFCSRDIHRIQDYAIWPLVLHFPTIKLQQNSSPQKEIIKKNPTTFLIVYKNINTG